ncbi:DUF805 domain-containing protein [Confluentibacter citreus]|uniref:DUF805 domain-containing protein n=1 Tax=Confluentibacter citreus TaxID=2007307 RepID=UPI000C284163|nr:DUF805 domain-containing protein [Confluentibacter citreus]
MFKNPFSFEGRIRRTEYGLSYLIYMAIYLGVAMFVSRAGESYSIIFPFLLIPLLWFLLAQGAKRCHDRGNSGWYQIIPFYGLWMLFGESDYGSNEYGDNPKRQGNHGAIEDIGQSVENE